MTFAAYLEGDFSEPSPASPHDERVERIIFELGRVATSGYPAFDLGGAVCALEEAVSAKNAEQLDPGDLASMQRALADAAHVVLNHHSTARYVEDIATGLVAVTNVLKRWAYGIDQPVAAGLTEDVRILRNALHNADLRLRRQERDRTEQCQHAAGMFEDIFGPDVRRVQ